MCLFQKLIKQEGIYIIQCGFLETYSNESGIFFFAHYKILVETFVSRGCCINKETDKFIFSFSKFRYNFASNLHYQMLNVSTIAKNYRQLISTKNVYRIKNIRFR